MQRFASARSLRSVARSLAYAALSTQFEFNLRGRVQTPPLDKENRRGRRYWRNMQSGYAFTMQAVRNSRSMREPRHMVADAAAAAVVVVAIRRDANRKRSRERRVLRARSHFRTECSQNCARGCRTKARYRAVLPRRRTRRDYPVSNFPRDKRRAGRGASTRDRRCERVSRRRGNSPSLASKL